MIYDVRLFEVRSETIMGFIRDQEERLVIGLLTSKYQKKNLPVPDISELKRQAARIVDEAHGIARERGKNVLSIIKDMAEEIRKK
jgi:hypothetical protein